ncbi:MAG: 3-phosphoserine/phosphohydroxythreonine transaminase [Acidimicrobiia bacterium]|nr:3-phosphoserine/phosphohydroxythreonine transaminase [Acidimicrobiia bacterium]NNF63286.1 3-phosphoserine/phosphohydroxythreonine transaminase [Acidimicrobiia bacterium]
MNRAINFSAGPCTLPLEVLEEAQAEFVDYHGAGMSLVEMSHRSDEYDQVHQEALALSSEVAGAPDDFAPLFIQGGASLQFAMVPMNLLAPGETAGYVDSGAWGTKAIEDGSHHGDLYTAWSGAAEAYRRMPSPVEIDARPASRYLHVTTNETIGGIRMVEWPETDVRLVGDVSSEFMSRPIPWDRFDVVYGGAQKNLGPAGVTVVFVRRSILERTNRNLAAYLRYDVHAATDSLHNTPPVFAVFMMGKVLKWMKASGGLAEMERRAEERAGLLYETIDSSGGFYTSPVEPTSRSMMNVVFRLPTEDLEASFIERATAEGMMNLKGHRSVGGVRASLYNAMPLEGVAALTNLMSEFKAAHG